MKNNWKYGEYFENSFIIYNYKSRKLFLVFGLLKKKLFLQVIKLGLRIVFKN